MGKTRHGSTVGWILNSVKELIPRKEGNSDMNSELKALLSLAFDLLNLGKDAVAKKNFILMLPELLSVCGDVPAAVGNIADLKAELAALPNAANQADLAAFIQTEVAGIGASANVQNILAAALKLVQDNVSDVEDLLAAIHSSPVVPAPAAASVKV